MGSSEPAYERLGAKVLSLPDVIAQSVGFMGPVFSSALILPLIVANLSSSGKGAGAATPIAIIIAVIGVAAIGWIVAAYARRIHAAGALYDYVSHGLGEQVGFLSGWDYYWGTAALTAAIPLGVGGITYGLLHDDIGWKHTPPYWAWGILWAVLLFGLLYFGVRISTRVQLGLVLVSATVLLGFFLYIIAKGGTSGNTIKPFLPSSSATGWSGIFFGVLYGVLIFIGFETAANLGEETAHPKRSIPMAIFLAIGIVGVLYLIAGYAQDIGFGLHADKWAASPAPVFELGAKGAFGSVWFDRVLQIMVILDMMAVGLGCGVATTRGVFALARDRRIPGILARVSRRYGTPAAATLFTTALCVAVPIWVRLGHGVLSRVIPGAPAGTLFPEWFPLFVWFAGFGGFALVIVYGLLAIGGLRGLWQYENQVALVIVALIGLAMAGGAVWGSIYKVPSPGNWIWRVTLIVAAVGVLVSLISRGRRPASKTLAELSIEARSPMG